MKKYLILFLFPLFFLSCEKEEVDPRDQYVGEWTYDTTGSLTMYYSGSAIGTVPAIDSGELTIKKSGENDLDIDGEIATLSGSRLIFEPKSYTQSQGQTTIQGTENKSGTASAGLISLKSVISGNWNSSGQSGILSGSLNYTLRKK